jgi:nitrate/nitrite transporter NarK
VQEPIDCFMRAHSDSMRVYITDPPLVSAACAFVAGGKYVGTLSGTMNMMGNLGGFVSPIVIGYIVEQTNNWTLTFYVTAAIYVIGSVFWLIMDPVTPLEEQVKD